MDVDEAPKTLLLVAEAALDVAAGMNKFLIPVSTSAADITDLIAKCFAISSALQVLARTVRNLRQVARYRNYRDEISDVAYSVDYTFKDVHSIVGEGFREAIEDGVPQATAFRVIWRRINEFFHDESGNSLSRRLEYYEAFLQRLNTTFVEGYPRDPNVFDDLAERIASLVEVQNPRFQPDLNASKGSPPPTTGVSKVPSFERQRPSTSNISPERPPRRPSQTRPPMEHDWEPWPHRRPPFAPEVPLSPTSSHALSSDSTNSNHSGAKTHWLSRLFDSPPPATALVQIGRSECFADPSPGAAEKLEVDYKRLVNIPFENGELFVSVYQRKHDRRARMLCEIIRPQKHRKECVQALNSLDVQRSGPFLKFTSVAASRRRSEQWVALRFPSYEKLVIFFCMFLALRSHDHTHPLIDFNDHRLHKEDVFFKGPIKGDQYDHILRVCKDRESGGIRLQASALGGVINKTPVWTAFITHQIHSPVWMSRASPKVIHLADLHKYVFTDAYDSLTAPEGQHELTFAKAADADDFEEAIEELANPPEKKKKKKKNGEGKKH